MKTTAHVAVIVILPLLVVIGGYLSAGAEEEKASVPPFSAEEHMFDFGRMGIDFDVLHTYHLVNTFDKPMKIEKITVSCDCCEAIALDSIIAPGDTAAFRLKFNSKNFFGPTQKYFTVYTDNPKLPEVSFYCQSIVGQWPDGIKPQPFSLFFLPGNAAKKVTIPNPGYKEITLAGQEPFDNTFTVNVLKEKAKKGQQLELEIQPASGLKKGTYLTNLTLYIEKNKGSDTTILTIPIKIVKY